MKSSYLHLDQGTRSRPYLEPPGDHFDVVTPTTSIRRAAAEAITAALT
ncbi:hypothetical protein [Nonomuraea sp. B1E8]